MVSWRAGADIDAFCGRCDLELAHVIVAMDGAKPARVQCKTCRTVHGFRRGEKKASPSKESSAPRKRTSRRVQPAESTDFETLIRGRNLSAARPYAISDRYAIQELLQHSTFGLGVVVGTPAGDKIAVVFRSNLKILAHDRRV
jgi:hypothetical protein